MPTFNGNNNDNLLEGGADADTFNAFGGDDIIRPGDGADTLYGGTGIDVASYFTAPTLVWASIDGGGGLGHALGDQYFSIEHLFGSDFDDILVGGNAISDTLSGSLGDDTLKGSGGSDVLFGGSGVDTVNYVASDEAVVIDAQNSSGFGGDATGDTYLGIERWVGSDYNDTFFGRNTSETFNGGDGNDTLKGSAGADSLIGGDGDDVVDYSDSASGVTAALDGAGTTGDATGDTFVGIEGLRGSDFEDTLVGNGEANELRGGDAADILKGAGGDDVLLGGDGADTILGASGVDILYGENGTDRLDGGSGNDTMEGGLGNDRYIVTDSGDVVMGEIGFASGGGIDTVESFVSFTLPSNVEILRLMGTDNINGTGSSGPDSLVGNVGNNTMTGGFGNDTINGKDGADVIIGSSGADTLIGEAGNDTFLYTAATESGVGASARDFINGFVHGQDHIDLSAIDANSVGGGVNDNFTFIDNAAFSGTGAASAGQLRWFTFGGLNVAIVEADRDGNGAADMQIFVNLTNVMLASDFFL